MEVGITNNNSLRMFASLNSLDVIEPLWRHENLDTSLYDTADSDDSQTIRLIDQNSSCNTLDGNEHLNNHNRLILQHHPSYDHHQLPASASVLTNVTVDDYIRY